MKMVKTILVVVMLLFSSVVSYAATGTYLEPTEASPGQPCPNDTRDVVRDETTGTTVRSSSGACVRTQWDNGYNVCGTRIVAPAPHLSRTMLSREDRTAYFGFNQAYLSPEMKERLDSLANALRSDSQVKGARIVGYADRIGNPAYNEKLSKKRAEAVRKYLVAKGIINTRVADTRWFGSSEPTAECSNSLPRAALIDCLQKDRRVEVEIDYAPDVNASR